jgi:PAS domain S-box-containing protein
MWKADVRVRLKTSAVWRYGLSVVSVAAALAATYLLQPYVFRTPLFFLAVMVSTWAGGTGPGLLAVLLSALSIGGIPNPQGVLEVRFQNAPNLAAFLITSLMVGGWSAGRRRAESALQQARDEVETKVRERTAELSHSNEQLRKEVAEHRRAEEALRRGEDRVRLIIDTIPVMSWSVRPDGGVDFLNRRWTEYAGLTLGQYAEDPTGPIHPQDLPRVMETWQAQMALGQAYEDELRLRRADGEYRWFLVRTAPLRDDRGSIVKWYGVATDIEDLKRAEDGISRQKEILQKIFDNVPIGITFFDEGGRLLMVNGAWERMFGWTLAELEGLKLDVFVEAVPDPRERRRVFDFMAAGTGEWGEFKARARGGREIVVRAAAVRLSDGAGIGIVQDITGRGRAEEALKESRRKLEEAQRIAHVGHWERELDTDVVIWSDEIFRIYDIGPRGGGLPFAEVLSMTHPEDRERMALAVEETIRGLRRYDVEYRIVRPGGEVRYVHSAGDVFRDAEGRPRRIFGVAQDITERRRAEEALRQSARDYRTLFEQAHDAILIFEPESEIILNVNRRACEIYGYSREELVGMSLERITKDIPRGKRQIRETLSAGSYHKFETVQYRKDGSPMHLEINASAIEYEGRRAILSINRDVTDRKRAEEERSRLTSRLLTAQEDERLRISRELHDHLGQYLAALMMGVKSVQKAEVLTPDLRERLASLENLTAQFSDDVRRFALELRPTALDDIGLDAALSHYTEEWSRLSGIEVDYQRTGLDKRRLPALVETALYRVIQEALNNALKHSQARRVSVIVERRAARVVAVLEDDGVGFDLRAALDNHASARGLGLVSMRERVESVGGTFEIESAPGCGTTIVVRVALPPGERGPDES